MLSPMLCAVLCAATAFQSTASNDWPAQRHDARRSGVTAESLSLPLYGSWTHYAWQAPAPSWPDPAPHSYWQNLSSIKARVVHDRAFHPVIQNGRLFFASSSEDALFCLDVKTGKELWHRTLEAPLRFAPLLAGDYLYFGGDDGCVHSLRQSDGERIWRTRIAPEERWIPGNGRIVSAWPIRTGVVVQDDVVYATCGLFPSQGCHAFALRAADGTQIWSQELGRGLSPQGYLLASKERLYVPTGRTNPFALGLADGGFLGSFGGPGGSFALLTGEELVSGTGNTGELNLSGSKTREKLASFAGNRMVVSGGRSYLMSDTQLSALERGRYQELGIERAGLETQRAQLARELAAAKGAAAKRELRERIVAIAEGLERTASEREACVPWAVAAKHPFSLILAGDTLFAGGDGEVAAYSTVNGEQLWSGDVEGIAWSLAVAEGCLFVGTDRGSIHCFGPDSANQNHIAGSGGNKLGICCSSGHVLNRFYRAGLETITSQSGVLLITEPIDGGLICFASLLPLLGGWETILLAADQQEADELNDRIEYAGGCNLPRTRVIIGDLSDMPFTSWFADIVVSEAALKEQRAPAHLPELLRVLRPSGGLLFMPHGLDTPAGLSRVADHEEDGFSILSRDKLPGSREWSHPYATAGNTACSEDIGTGGELALQWFGGPGPATMIDRHLRTAPALTSDGRLFIPGHDQIIAVNAYNGFELWKRELPGFSRTGVPFDGGYWAVAGETLYAAVNASCMALDVTGKKSPKAIYLPRQVRPLMAGDKNHWGWLVHDSAALFGSATPEGAPRKLQSRGAVVSQYAPSRPLVCSRGLFRMEPPYRKASWVTHTGWIPHSSLALDAGRLIFLESGDTKSTRKPQLQEGQVLGRRTFAQLREGGSELVALDASSGKELWRIPFAHAELQHSLYVVATQDRVLLTGAGDKDDRNWYFLWCFDAASGKELWHSAHGNSIGGFAGDHGEQVHHPVVQGQIVYVEPVAYDFMSGERIDPCGTTGAKSASGYRLGNWSISARRGCGTLSASAESLFFRNQNPTRYNVLPGAQPQYLTQISRPGCWVNILPSSGLVLLPESSSGCVCAFPLQTSMAFLPARAR